MVLITVMQLWHKEQDLQVHQGSSSGVQVSIAFNYTNTIMWYTLMYRNISHICFPIFHSKTDTLWAAVNAVFTLFCFLKSGQYVYCCENMVSVCLQSQWITAGTEWAQSVCSLWMSMYSNRPQGTGAIMPFTLNWVTNPANMIVNILKGIPWHFDFSLRLGFIAADELLCCCGGEWSF